MPSANDWVDRGLVAHQAGQAKAAAMAYREALEVDPDHPDALNLLGVLAHQAGDHEEAVRLIGRAVLADPTAADFYANLAEAHRAAGAPALAIKAYSRSAHLDGGNAAVWANLAMLLHRAMRFAEAVGAWKHAVEIEPGSADYQNNYGLSLSQAGRTGEAFGPFRQALSLRPDFPAAIENWAEACVRGGRPDDAVSAARRLVDLRPADAGCWVYFAAVCNDADRPHDAIDACREAIKLQPDRAEAHFVLGQSLARMGESAGAAVAYAKVTDLRPDAAGGHANLGLAAMAVGQMGAAAEALREATEVDPNYPEAWFNLAVVHERLSQYDKAIEYAERARALRPGWAEASCMIANLHMYQGRHAAAESEYKRALDERPQHPPALVGLGNVHVERGDHRTAGAYLRSAIESNPLDPVAHSVMLMSMVAGGGFTPADVFAQHLEFGRRFDRPAEPHANDRNPARRLRVGYLSPDLRAHSVSFFLSGVLTRHDHAKFEIVAYDDTTKPDTVSRWMRTLCDGWHRVTGMTNEQVAALIRDHEIDILVDLTGHTANNRLPLFAAKPAPVQVSYIGYPATSGLRAIDYRFTDALADPPGLTEEQHSEKLVRLGRSFLAYSPPQEPDVTPLPALSAGHVTFASFNNTTKIHREVLALWARVLHAVPGSRLVLKANGLADEALRARMTATFAELGIAAGRLECLARTRTLGEHLDVYGRCDIALDPFPYNGTTTTCEAMWMGVPVVTLAGRTHAGRVGVSLLTNVGLPDWVAETADEYVAVAARMAADLPRLAALRAGLREQMRASPVMDAADVTSHIEEAYRTMWQDYCRAAGPAPAATPSAPVPVTFDDAAAAPSLLVEGWRSVAHSYALVNQHQCGELAKRPGLVLYHHDATWLDGVAAPRALGLLSAAEERVVAGLPDRPAGRGVDVAYRICYPPDTAPNPAARRTFVFVTSEFLGQFPPLPRSLAVDFVTSSEWSRAGLLRAGADPARVHVVPIGVDTAVFRPRPAADREAARRRHGLGDGFVYLHVGAMTLNKNVGAVLRAFARVSAGDPSAVLLLKGSDAMYRSSQLLAEALSGVDPSDLQRVQQRTRYVGGTLTGDEMAALYAAADCYVTPYKGEAFNMPALEAVACGLPVIATAGGPTDAFGDDSVVRRIRSTIVGVVADGRPCQALEPDEAHLLELMRQAAVDPGWAASAREAGPAFARNHFAWPVVVDQLLGVLGLAK
ncbi:MAG: tetratricopeptide repeat protein [Phycisphaerales bacterium]|nr:tetratricopeptide repeat protein [Phycisphaerales bacterium]